MIPLFKPYMPIELPELDAILHSGALAYGRWGKLFETKLGEYIGGEPKIATVNSYNSAMLVALTTLGIKPGDEIIASPMSCLASNQPFVTQGVNVVWSDIDPETGTLNPESVRLKITSKTKAIFHNHFCGYSGYIDEINAIGKDYGVFVVDDAIEAFGSEYKGRKIGAVETDMTILSFQSVRLPNTIDGGAIVFKDKQMYEKALLVRDYGIDRSSFRDKNGEIAACCDITMPGYGVTLSEINSYIGCLQLDKIEELLELQDKNAQRWKVKIEDEYAHFSILEKTFQKPNYWIFGVLVPNKLEVILDFRKKGFYASGVHLPNNYYSVFGKHVDLKGVDEFYSRFVALPCGWWFFS